MSCNKMNTLLLGGRRGTDGMYPVQRPILFSEAGRLVADALPQSCSLTYVRQRSEPELAGVPSVECDDNACFFQMVAAAIADMPDGDVMILSTPMPEVTAEEYQLLLDRHSEMDNAITAMVDGVHINEWHAAVCNVKALREVLERQPHSLTQAMQAAGELSEKTGLVRASAHTAVYDACDAYHVQRILMRRINSALMRSGVTMVDPECTYISPYCTVGAGTTILPGCMLYPGTTVGCGCTIGPNAVLDGAVIGDGTRVNSSQVYDSVIGARATVGPYAYIRPGCDIGDETRIGDFVELKKARIGSGTKVSHLTYIGDAVVGTHVNFGCGTVVVNYDGFEKHQTVIGDDCFIGCNTNLVAPVTLGDRVLTAAGTTVTRDVPDGALAASRVRQENHAGWNDRRRRLHGQK